MQVLCAINLKEVESASGKTRYNVFIGKWKLGQLVPIQGDEGFRFFSDRDDSEIVGPFCEDFHSITAFYKSFE